MFQFVVGIDPGRTGALVAVEKESLKVVGLVDMPRAPHPKAKPGSSRNIIDLPAVKKWLEELGLGSFVVILEEQQYVPDTGKNRGGARASSILLEEYGKLYGLLIGMEIRFEIVHPRTWQSKLDVRGDTKASSIARAQRMFPDADFLGGPRVKKPKDGRADALNLVDYAIRLRL